MDRVTNSLISNNFMQDVYRQQEGMEKVQKQLSAHTKILSPEDDPVGTAEFMHQKSRLHDIDRFDRNINFSKGRVDLTEASLKGINDSLQRARELAVQGANGTYSDKERYDMGLEVNQILEQVVQLANTQYQNSSLFGGTNGEKQAFNVETGKVIDPKTGLAKSSDGNILKVEYQGDNQNHFAEVGRGEYIKTNLTGNNVFFSSNQVITSGTPGSNYIAPKDSTIRIDGVEIEIKAGDNTEAVAQKINNAKIDVHASIDNSGGQNLLSLETTNPHQMYIEDLNGGTVMQNLGIVSSAVAKPPHNYAASASNMQNSMFDRLIQLRDGLYNNDSEAINRGIGGVDEALQHNLNQTAQIGSIQNRMEGTAQRLSEQKLYTGEVMSKLNDLDVADAIVTFKNWETELQTSLQVGSKLLPRTLLDYLR